MMLDMEIGRRRLLGGALFVGASSFLGAGKLLAAGVEQRIAFRNAHTNETFDARFYGPSGWDAEGLAEINHGLRDWRTNEVAPMDRQLVLLLASIRDSLGIAATQQFDLISGYRSPATNAGLRAKGGEHTGVATKSQHMLGKATDVRMPGIALDRLKQVAMSKQAGGVGYYPKDGFVHIDTARVRYW